MLIRIGTATGVVTHPCLETIVKRNSRSGITRRLTLSTLPFLRTPASLCIYEYN